MSSKRESHQEEIRFRVLKLINENPKISTREIARLVGISNGAAYYCLSALIKISLPLIINALIQRLKSSDLFNLSS